MAAIGLKKSFNSNTSCFSNLCLFKCFRKYKSKSYLNSLVMTIVIYLSLGIDFISCCYNVASSHSNTNHKFHSFVYFCIGDVVNSIG